MFLRFDLVHRTLAILGLIGILLQFTGVTLMGFLGYSTLMQLAMPLAPIHIVNGLWLIVKGFKEPHLPLPAEARVLVAG